MYRVPAFESTSKTNHIKLFFVLFLTYIILFCFVLKQDLMHRSNPLCNLGWPSAPDSPSPTTRTWAGRCDHTWLFICLFKAASYCAAQVTRLPQPPECYDCGLMPSCSLYVCIFLFMCSPCVCRCTHVPMYVEIKAQPWVLVLRGCLVLSSVMNFMFREIALSCIRF